MKKKILACLLLVLVCFTFTGCSDLKKEKEKLNDIVEKYGTVEKESISTTVAKFNTEVVDNGSEGLNPAMEDYLTVEKDAKEYWYGLNTGIHMFIKALDFTGNKDNDVVNFMGIYYYKDASKSDEKMALEYVKHLIKANNPSITEEEIDSLIEDAKKLSSSGKTANNGKGISVGILEKDDHYEYQVVRLYGVEE